MGLSERKTYLISSQNKLRGSLVAVARIAFEISLWHLTWQAYTPEHSLCGLILGCIGWPTSSLSIKNGAAAYLVIQEFTCWTLCAVDILTLHILQSRWYPSTQEKVGEKRICLCKSQEHALRWNWKKKMAFYKMASDGRAPGHSFHWRSTKNLTQGWPRGRTEGEL